MSQENVRVARAAHRAMQDRDFDTLITLCSEDIEWRQDPRAVEPGTYHGHDGVRRFFASLYETFEDFMPVPERYLEAGDKVVALLHVRAIGPASGIIIDNDVANVLTMRDGRIAVLQIYLDRAAALADAGLAER
jgi:ketosteroid isomerase-like protein